MPKTEPAAVLLLRVWREGEGPNNLRVRFIYTPKAGEPDTRAVAGSVDDVCAALRDWIVSHVPDSDAVTRR